MKPTVEVLRAIREGDFMHELGDSITQAVSAARETGKSAEVTVKIKIRPKQTSTGVTAYLEDKISLKLPAVEKSETMFFVTEDNGLQLEHPKQPSLPGVALRDVDKETGEVRNAVA